MVHITEYHLRKNDASGVVCILAISQSKRETVIGRTAFTRAGQSTHWDTRDRSRGIGQNKNGLWEAASPVHQYIGSLQY